MLSSRQQRMLKKLIEEKGYIKISELSCEHGISPRTVRNDLLAIEDFLRSHQIVLERNRSLGVRLLIDIEKEKELINLLQAKLGYIDSKERLKQLAKRLLEECELSVEELINDLQISKNTFLIDLSLLRKQLSDYQLKIYRDKGKLHLLGSERNKREAYLSLLKGEIKNEKIIQMFISHHQNLWLTGEWETWFKYDRIEPLLEAVGDLERTLKIEFSDIGYSALILHLLMAIERLKKEHHIMMEEKLLSELCSTKEFRIIRETLCKRIHTAYGVHVPLEEIGYITQHVLGSQKELENEVSSDHYLKTANKIIHEVEKKLGYVLRSSEKVSTRLAVHLKPAIYRAKFGLQTENPLMKQLEREYGPLLDLTEQVVNNVLKEEGISFSRDEIGYVAMHICSGMEYELIQRKRKVAIVCSSGLGTAAMLERKMNVFFPQVEIVGIYSYKELQEMRSLECDAIFSTIDILYSVPVPWLRVSPLLTEEDQEKVSNLLMIAPARDSNELNKFQTILDVLKIVEQNATVINRKKMTTDLLKLFQIHQETNNDKNLTDLLPKQSILLRQHVHDWREAVHLGNQLLCQAGSTTVNYGQKLINLIEKENHHFIIMEGVAFPHTTAEDGVLHTGFSLLTFKQPIPFGYSKTAVWLVIMLSAIDQWQHKKAMAILIDLLNDHDFLSFLQEASDRNEVWQKIHLREVQ